MKNSKSTSSPQTTAQVQPTPSDQVETTPVPEPTAVEPTAAEAPATLPDHIEERRDEWNNPYLWDKILDGPAVYIKPVPEPVPAPTQTEEVPAEEVSPTKDLADGGNS